MASAEAHSTADWKSMELNKKGVNEKLKGGVNKGDVNKDVSLNRLFSVSSPI